MADTPRRPAIVLEDSFGLPAASFQLPPQYRQYLSNVLIPHGMVMDRVDKMGALRARDLVKFLRFQVGQPVFHGVTRPMRAACDIREDYPESTIMFLVVLKGGSEFATDLTRAIRKQHTYTTKTHLPFTVDYVRVKSYEGTASTGNGTVVMLGEPSHVLTWNRDPLAAAVSCAVTISGIDMKVIAGRDIVLLEDIIDTGATMQALIPLLMSHKPKSVRVAALLEKRTPKSVGFKADYVGFNVPDAFVVGYGLDYNEAYRDMPHICTINAEGIAFFHKHAALEGL
jgi:hypoxanthine phosphoribosyltransferase